MPPRVSSPGFEVGACMEALAGLQSSIALWKFDFDSELVYVGDAGVTEAAAALLSAGQGAVVNTALQAITAPALPP